MKTARVKPNKSDSSAASAALTALVRLLAKQTAREWLEVHLEAGFPAAEAPEQQK
jgi:hypothetical protein